MYNDVIPSPMTIILPSFLRILYTPKGYFSFALLKQKGAPPLIILPPKYVIIKDFSVIKPAFVIPPKVVSGL
jgi:hypothetical protein